MKTTLVILAAGIGARFGGGIKQLEPVGVNGEIIMDYSIHDAMEAGFNKIIFIIRKDIEADFKKIIGNRIEALCQKLNVEIQYAYQSLEDLPEGVKVPEGRKKPWGTGQAVLTCKEFIHEPFAVINADDYYGKESFKNIYEFLQGYDPGKPNAFCVAGYILKNTLSENGGVTRGICKVDHKEYLSDITETSDIVKTENGAAVDGIPINADAFVSMNMWGLTPDFLELLEKGFQEFFDNIKGRELQAEYLLPIFIGQLLREGKVSVKVLPTKDKWFGVTYLEDIPMVKEAFEQLIKEGIYGMRLFEDL